MMASQLKYFFIKLRALKNIYCRSVYYRISSIDAKRQIVVLHVIQKSIFIKLNLAEIISDSEIIEGLSCQQACWVGVHYGKALRAAQAGKSHLKNTKKPAYLLKHKYGHYKITGENRDGTITCLHVKTKKELMIHPLSIAKDELFINHFDANQACYVGMLAGLAIEKKQSRPSAKQSSVPYLRVVR